MDPSDIIPFDLHRLFLGEQPVLFHAEIVLRSILIYLWTLVLVRWIGGRSVSQLSLVDFVLVIALGSAVGDATLYADVPLLQAMLVVAVIVVASKGLERLTLRWAVFNRVLGDHPVEVVRDGVLQAKGMQACNLSPEALRELLRLRDVKNLGEVRRAWIEGNGALSILRAEPVRPGLPIMPPAELSPLPPARGSQPICASCGAPVRDAACGGCGRDATTDPMLGAAFDLRGAGGDGTAEARRTP